MTKERARAILENWWYSKCRLLGENATLPIKDEVVYCNFIEGSKNEIEQFSFLYLVKIAYGLRD